MKKEVRLTEWQYLGMLLTGIGAGVTLGYVLGHRLPFSFDKDGWDVSAAVGQCLGALATFLAAGVALHIATRQERKEREQRDRKEHEEARLTSALLMRPFVVLLNDVNLLLRQLHDLPLVDSDSFLDQISLAKWDLETFRACVPRLTALPGEAATKLAYAIGVLDLIQAEISHQKAINRWQTLDRPGRRSTVSVWTPWGGQAATYIAETLSAMRAVIPPELWTVNR